MSKFLESSVEYLKKKLGTLKVGEVQHFSGKQVSSRPMKFPYTFTAQMAQFPLRYYIKNNWIWRYYAIAIFVALPAFYKINQIMNSEGNVRKWDEIRRLEREEGRHH